MFPRPLLETRAAPRPSARRLAAALLGLLLAVPGCEGRPGLSAPAPDDSCTSGNCQTPETPPETPPYTRPEGSIRIAAFNVHRLFDTSCDSGDCGGSAYEELPSPEAFAAQVDQLAVSIRSLDAEVVLLEEIETQASLDALKEKTGFAYAVLGETGAPASVDVAVLSAHPITRVVSHYRNTVLTKRDGTTTRFSRDLLEVHLDARGSEVVVFPAHFRSKVSDDPERRYAEAVASHGIVSDVARASPGALVVLGGDLNDMPGSEPLTALEEDGALLRVSSDRPAGETWTYSFGGSGQAIDHLYIARVAAGGGTYVPGSFRVARDSNRGGFGGSDHGAVVADFMPGSAASP